MRFWFIAYFLITLSARAAELKAHVDAKTLFVSEIRPMLREKCFGCHGDEAKKIKGDLDMRTLAGLLKGGESELPALVPGKPEESLLFISATWQDPDLEMPPKENERLSVAQLEKLRTWIAAGAPWVEDDGASDVIAADWHLPDEAGRVRVRTAGGTSTDWTNRRYAPDELWSFLPRKPVVPPAKGHPIDAFINRALKQAGGTPAGRADLPTLLRRMSYGLTGLPPDAALRKSAADATRPIASRFNRAAIKHLLASPHYGERMAQHWLDVVRYADSNGFSRDEFRADAHKYRSYVIDSFNQDKPFDRFVREQIAGDELKLAGQEALSFLWMGPWEITNMTSPVVARQLWLDDVVNSIGVSFLGHELRCAKCHDHKFDPIPTRDYYAMQAVFASTKHHKKAGQFAIATKGAEQMHILRGGALEAKSDPVQPGLLSAVHMAKQYPLPQGDSGRRAAMANWIADAENPLTARVIVNRVWQWHFGRGLVETANGFGKMGAKPTHPELLDYLANWFIEHGWSIKKLHALILSSETYRRASGTGEHYASFAPRRLTAEEIRDSMLATTGELNRKVGGPSNRPQINWEVAHQPRLAMGKLTPPYEPDVTPEQRNRRSLYAVRVRNLGQPFAESFNLPRTEMSCDRRDETTVVTQSFTLMHSAFSHDRALALAQKLLVEDPVFVMENVFTAVLGRSPDGEEQTLIKKHEQDMLELHKNFVPEQQPLPTRVTLSNIREKDGQPVTQTFELKKMKEYQRDAKPWDANAWERAVAELALVLFNTSEFLYVY